MLFLHSFSPICSQTFEDIVQRCGVESTEGNVQQWVAEIAAVLNLKLRYSPLLHQRLADRYKHYARCLKIKKEDMEEHSISARHGLSPLKMLMWILSSFSSARVTELTNSVHFDEGAFRQCGLIEKEQNGI